MKWLGARTSDNALFAGRNRYLKARKPELYKDILGKANISEQKVSRMET